MRQTLLLGVTGVAFVCLFGYHKVYLPQREQVRLIRNQIAQEQASQRSQADVARVLLQVEGYRNRLAPDADPSWLVRELVRLGEQSNIQFTTIDQDPPQPYQKVTRLTVNLQLQASYHQLGTFLDELERSERFIRVDHFSLTPRGDKEGDLASIRLVVSAFYLPPSRGRTTES